MVKSVQGFVRVFSLEMDCDSARQRHFHVFFPVVKASFSSNARLSQYFSIGIGSFYQFHMKLLLKQNTLLFRWPFSFCSVHIAEKLRCKLCRLTIFALVSKQYCTYHATLRLPPGCLSHTYSSCLVNKLQHSCSFFGMCNE